MTNRYFLIGPLIRPLWLLGLTLLLCLDSLAQSNRFTLKGRVADANGSGVPGVTVQVLGTQTGTTSDADGNYSLGTNLAPGPYTLNFSAVGYGPTRQTVTLGNAETITTDATLKEDVLNLDEVVIPGSALGGARRELGNAINTIRTSDLQQSGSAGLLNSLQGKVPGAQITQNSGDPAGALSVRLRGIKSLSGSSDPLYVIDGVIVSNQSTNVSQLALQNDIGQANPGQNRLADINPNDIASINVVNGAAAAAQYGSRAANGVVFITTKRGSTGAPRVTVSISGSVNELRKSVPVNLYGKQFGSAALRLYTIATLTDAQVGYPTGTPTYVPQAGETFLRVVRDGIGSTLRTNLVDVMRYNYFDQIFRTGYGTDNAVSVSGGRDNTQYYVSFGYLNNQGIIKGTDFTRYNLRARVDQRLTNWAKLSAGLSYINSFSNEKANGNVFYSPINAVNITNNIYDITVRDAGGNLQAVEPSRVNPLSTIEDMKFTQSVSRTISDLQLNLTPLKGLSVDYILGVDAYGQLGKSYIRPYPYQAQAILPAARYPFGFAATANNQVLLINSDLNATYERMLTDAFKVNVVVGYNYQFSQQDLTSSQGESLAPFIETVRGASSTTVRSDYSLDRYNLSGYFAQATVGFRNLAFLTGAVRRDRSSKFSASETNQLYPKVSGSVVVSDLGFWKNANFSNSFNSLKVRASYGEAGNLSGIGSYDRFYQFTPVGFLGRNTIVPGTTLANPAVRPERMAELEGGADLSFLGNRLGLSITAYRQRISDLVVRRVLAASTGGTGIVNNVGTMENKGLEIMLDVTPVKTRNLTWDFTAIFNRNRNRVLEIGSPVIEILNAAGAPVYLLKGQPAGVFYGTDYARKSDGSLILTPQGFPQSDRAVGQVAGSTEYVQAIKSDGQLDYGAPTANIIIGDPNPKWTGSFSTNLNYKGLGLHVLLDAVQGVSVFNADKRTRQGVGLGDVAGQELRGDIARGYIFAIYNTQSWRVDDGSYTKLREVALSYTLPKLVKAASNVTVSVVGRNLYSWDKYTGFDPETNAGGTTDLLRGIDFGNVPIPRTYQLKLTATF